MAIGRIFARAGGRAKTIAVSIAATATLLLALVGCGVIGEKYTYIEWYALYFENFYPRWFAEFEKAHADQNVKIKFRATVASMNQTTYTMLISHTLADVTGVMPLTFENDCLEPVGPDDLDKDDFLPLAISMAHNSRGVLVGYPTSTEIRGFVYYNNDCLKEAGTTAAEAPETFDEYRAWASRMFEWDVNGRTVVGIPPDGQSAGARMLRRPIGMNRGYFWSSLCFILAYMDPIPDSDGKSDGSIDDYVGGPPSNRPFRFDSPEFIKGLDEYRKFFLPKGTAVADGDTGREEGFKNGIYAGMEGSNWIYGEVFTIDLQPTRYPHAPGRKMKTWMNASSYAVSKESKHKELAKEFVKFITGTDCQVDQYYGHGYMPARFSAWRRLEADAAQDIEIRKRFLLPVHDSGGYVGLPQVTRRSHDSMDIILYVPFSMDMDVVRIEPTGALPIAASAETVPAAENISGLSARYYETARRLQADITAFTGQNVSVIVRGTPPDMLPYRSFVLDSPVSIYTGLLDDSGVYVPLESKWERLIAEVVTRALQFITRVEDPMTPEEAAKWAQKEAEDIVAGRK